MSNSPNVLKSNPVDRATQLDSSKGELLSMKTLGVSRNAQGDSMAYGTMIYARSTQPGGTVTSRFVTSNSRVAPMKAVCIPRLELLAAVLGV